MEPRLSSQGIQLAVQILCRTKEQSKIMCGDVAMNSDLISYGASVGARLVPRPRWPVLWVKWDPGDRSQGQKDVRVSLGLWGPVCMKPNYKCPKSPMTSSHTHVGVSLQDVWPTGWGLSLGSPVANRVHNWTNTCFRSPEKPSKWHL